MITTTGSPIATAIDTHIRTYGGPYSAWYCGITADPNDRLINGHNADGRNNAARYWDAGSDAVARRIEQHFFAKGCKGGGGGGDHRTRYVYVYKISLTTRE